MHFLQRGIYSIEDFLGKINKATQREHIATRLKPFSNVVLGITRGTAYVMTKGTDEIHVMMRPTYADGEDVKFHAHSIRNFLTTEGYLKIDDSVAGSAD